MPRVQLPLPADWLVPQWPAPDRVRAVFSTRSGGVSKAPFDSMNPALHVGDIAADVWQNRGILRSVLGVNPVYLAQVHGTQVVQLTAAAAVDEPQGAEIANLAAFQADGCWTQTPGAVCSIMVADCLPVLLTNLAGDFVAAAHAGWRGLAGAGSRGILEALLESVSCHRESEASFSRLNGCMAWLGPCIGATRFEVGDEVRAAFVAFDAKAAQMFKPVLGGKTGKWLADLQGLARQRLAALGVTAVYGNDGSEPWCTVSNPSVYFSYRRDNLAVGGSGRMVACIWLEQGTC